jgi:hypothetical protein
VTLLISTYNSLVRGRVGRSCRTGGEGWGPGTTLPTIQLDLAEKGIVRDDCDLCPSLQTHVSFIARAMRCWWWSGVRYGEGLPSKVEVDAKCLLDCTTERSVARLQCTEGRGAALPTLNPLPKASSSSIPAHTGGKTFEASDVAGKAVECDRAYIPNPGATTRRTYFITCKVLSFRPTP